MPGLPAVGVAGFGVSLAVFPGSLIPVMRLLVRLGARTVAGLPAHAAAGMGARPLRELAVQPGRRLSRLLPMKLSTVSPRWLTAA